MSCLSLPVDELSRLCVSIRIQVATGGLSFSFTPLDAASGSSTSLSASSCPYAVKFETHQDGHEHVLRVCAVLDNSTNHDLSINHSHHDLLSVPSDGVQLSTQSNYNLYQPLSQAFGTFNQSGNICQPQPNWSTSDSTLIASTADSAANLFNFSAETWAISGDNSALNHQSDQSYSYFSDPASTSPNLSHSSPQCDNSLRAQVDGKCQTNQPENYIFVDSTSSSSASSPAPTFDSESDSPKDSPTSRSRNRSLACPKCSRSFTSEYTFKVHLAAHKPKVPKSLPCTMSEDCHERFSRQHDRLRHEVVKHGRLCEWVCDDCGKFFSSQRTLSSHVCSTGSVSRWGIQPRSKPSTVDAANSGVRWA